ncbi:MAG: helix-turn-helix transcriptional regulator [Lachnospiraceae bacterium]|nr:helix-turn-helix transcriptional regulator [Lachnospiraceae bacterium]
MNQQDFGLRLTKLRISRNLTQSQISNKIGLSRQAYINYEKGRCMPSAEIIAKLSQVLGVDLMESLYDHSPLSFVDNKERLSTMNRDDYFSILELYSRLSPLNQKRIFTLMNLMVKGDDD